MKLNIYESQLGQSVSCTELYEYFELHKNLYSRFVQKEIIRNPYASEGKDYLTKLLSENRRGRFRQDYHLNIDFAMKLCMVSKSEKGEEVRDYLLSLMKKVDNRQLITAKQAAFAYVLINTFQYEEFQIEAEGMHKKRFMLTSKAKGNLHKLFADHRNDLLDISNDRLKATMIEQCKAGAIPLAKAKNIRRRIFMLDRYKLIRDAVVDLLVSKGEDAIDALNFAETVKEMAEHANIEIKLKNEDNLLDGRQNVQVPKDLPLLN